MLAIVTEMHRGVNGNLWWRKRPPKRRAFFWNI